MFQKIAYIVNPASQNGATAKRWPRMSQRLPKAHEVLHTQGPREATSLAQAAAQAGADLVVAVGGDGTLQEVVSGLMLVDAAKRPALGMVPLGTGGDFRRTVGYPIDPSSIGAILQRGRTRKIDVGSIRFKTHAGGQEVRHFINVASFGLSGVVDAEVNRTSKALGGKVSFAVGTLRGLLKFNAVDVEVSLDDGPFERKQVMLMAACNGRCFGGGMQLAPTADPSDGMFEIVTLTTQSKLDLVKNMSTIYDGSHLGKSSVQYASARRLSAKSQDTVLIDLDGEAPGMLPLDIEIIPQALALVC